MSDFPYEFCAIIVDKGIWFSDWIFWEKFQVLKKDFKSQSKSKNCWIFGFFKSTDQILPTFGSLPRKVWFLTNTESAKKGFPRLRELAPSYRIMQPGKSLVEGLCSHSDFDSSTHNLPGCKGLTASRQAGLGPPGSASLLPRSVPTAASGEGAALTGRRCMARWRLHWNQVIDSNYSTIK